MKKVFTMHTLLLFLLCMYACRQPAGNAEDSPGITTITAAQTETLQAPAAPLQAEWIEDFSGSKGAYEAGEVTLATGVWLFDDALIANDAVSTKGDNKAARVRNKGRLSMRFDVPRADTVWIRYATYKSDAPSGWQLWMSTDGGASYEPRGNTVTATAASPAQTYFPIHEKGNIRFEIRKVSGSSNRINFLDMKISQGITTPAGKVTSVHADNSHMLMGNPTAAVHSIGNPDNYLIDHKYYVESYNRSKGTPNWVSWHLGVADLGNTDRIDDFRPDKSLPGGWYEISANSYKNTGFDKGHNCPSGDRTASRDANSSTFLMDNIIPQAPKNNQQTWEHLESYCRDMVKKGYEVYLVMGNYGTGGTGANGYASTIDNGRINVPAHIWKVAVLLREGNNDLQRVDKDTKVIAIDTPNDNAVQPDWMKYLTTVDAIEKVCQCDLLSALPPDVQAVIESKKFAGGN